MKRSATFFLTSLAPFVAPAFTALAVAFVPSESAADDARLKKAGGIYKQFCSHCHGLDMVNPGTSSYDLRKWPRDKKSGFIESVTKGKGDMPAWGDILTEDELEHLWYYVSTRAGKEQLPQATAPDIQKTGAVTSSGEAPVPVDGSLVEDGTLTVCLARNGGVMSGWSSKGGSGLEYVLSHELADRLGLSLEVIWFESEQEEESNPVKETYAMLSYGLCDVVPGFSLYETGLGPFNGERAALPRWDDMPEVLPRGFQVDLKPVDISVPYIRLEMGIVVTADAAKKHFTSISDLDGLKVGMEQGTLAGVLTMRQGTDGMVAGARTFNPGPAFLWKMENGAFEAALVTVTAFDSHRKQNPVTELELTDYRHPLGFNLAYAVSDGNDALLGQINSLISDLLADGTLAGMAAENGVSYAVPTKPFVQKRLTLSDILTVR